jgi:hypothetical protein
LCLVWQAVDQDPTMTQSALANVEFQIRENGAAGSKCKWTPAYPLKADAISPHDL